MAKVQGPLFSEEATGRLGTALSFKKGAVWNSAIPQFSRTRSVSSKKVAAEVIFQSCVATWKALTDTQLQAFIDDKPSNLTTYQYFMSVCIPAGGLSFPPELHNSSHENGGADEISVLGLSGLLADEQDAGKICGVVIDDTDIGDGKILTYDSGSNTLIYV